MNSFSKAENFVVAVVYVCHYKGWIDVTMPYTFQRTKPPLQTVSSEPPDKRRRMGDLAGSRAPPTAPKSPQNPPKVPPVPTLDDDDWGALDDDFALTEDQLEEIDFMASQAIASVPKIDNKPQTSTFIKPSGPAMSKNNSKTLVKPKVQSNVPFYNSHKEAKPTVKPGGSRLSEDCSQRNGGKMPPARNGGLMDPGIMDAEMQRLLAENEQMKSQMASLKETDCGRNGEIKMLRQMLKQKETDIFKHKQNQLDVVDQQAKDHLQKQKQLESQLDKLKAQIQFKDQEINEFSSSLKRLEQRLQSDHAPSGAPGPPGASHGTQGPSTQVSPKLNRRFSAPQHASPKTSKQDSFPTTQSFIGKRPSPHKVMLAATVQTDPVIMDTVVDRNEKDSNVKKVNLPKRCKLRTNSNQGILTGPLLVGKLQTETESGVYKMLELCQNLPNSGASDVELRHLAEAALAGLLSKTRAKVVSKPLECDTQGAIDVLPLICYVVDDHLTSNSDETTPKTVKSDSQNSSQSLLCLEASLDVLKCLVLYSSAVRATMLDHVSCHVTSSSPVAGPSGDDGKHLSCLQSDGSKLLSRICQLLHKTSTQVSNSSKGLMDTCLCILERLASQASQSQLDGLEVLVQAGVLSDVVTASRERVDTVLCCTRLVQALAQSNKLLTSMCKQSDQCTFYCLYSSLQSCWPSSPDSHTVALGESLVQLISTIVSGHKGGATFLQEADCSCSEELPKTLCLSLHAQAQLHPSYRGAPSEDSRGTWESQGAPASHHNRIVRTMRKGLMLLYSLSVRGMSPDHFSEVEMQYIAFVNHMKRIIPALEDTTENEIIGVRYLWDFDEDSGHEENSNTMDWDT